MVFTVAVFTKLSSAQWNCVQTCRAWFTEVFPEMLQLLLLLLYEVCLTDPIFMKRACSATFWQQLVCRSF
jgi:hypothetical protein